MRLPRTLPDRTIDWFEERLRIRGVVEYLINEPMPTGARTFFLGGVTLFFFIIQAITGTLLVLYYRPTPEAAYESILLIMNQVNFGWLIRSLHAWSANLMILACIGHMLRVYFQGVYKKPRELTWMVGVLLLGVTLLFGFTGYLLPWDQTAYWASTVGTEIAGAMPLVGGPMLNVLRAGTDITGMTLSRFFGIHVLILPIIISVLLAVHIFLIHQIGLADPTGRWQGPHHDT